VISPSTLNRAVLTTEHRALIVRQLGAALAAAWRQQHQPSTAIEIDSGARKPSSDSSGPSGAVGERELAGGHSSGGTREGATGGAGTSPAAV
jgi:hypothetical protein